MQEIKLIDYQLIVYKRYKYGRVLKYNFQSLHI